MKKEKMLGLFIILLVAMPFVLSSGDDSCLITQDACKITCPDTPFGTVERGMRLEARMRDGGGDDGCNKPTNSFKTPGYYYQKANGADFHTSDTAGLTVDYDSEEEGWFGSEQSWIDVDGSFDFSDLDGYIPEVYMTVESGEITIHYEVEKVSVCPRMRIEFSLYCTDNNKANCRCTIFEGEAMTQDHYAPCNECNTQARAG